MADLKISQLTATTSLDGTEEFPLARGGTTKKITASNLLAQLGAQVPGIDGAPGPGGPTGATGPQGLDGVDGSRGSTGAAGPQGTTGPTGVGSTGPTGPAGLDGLDGTQGVTGSPGPTGATGTQGATGTPAGATGATGVAGQDGLDGAPGVSASTKYVLLRDEKTSATDGGTFTSGSYQTRTLNTEVSDDDGICSLSSNQFTLSAGTYLIRASAPAFEVLRHKIRLQNVTDASTILLGTSQYANGNTAVTSSTLVGKFTIGASKALELQHRCESTVATLGFGVQDGFGDIEVYAVVELWKIS